jgi:hypothetical protein
MSVPGVPIGPTYSPSTNCPFNAPNPSLGRPEPMPANSGMVSTNTPWTSQKMP